MALKVQGTTVIDDSRNIQNIGIATATTFSGQVNAGVGTITTLTTINSNITGIATATTLKVGTAVTISAGVVTATSFVGSGANLTGLPAGYTELDGMLFG